MITRLSGLFVFVAVMAAHAAAQTSPAPSGVEVFEPAYFSRFNPTNAADMVRQLPGFDLEDGARVRGFGGAAGNVLINGERPSTKGGLNDFLGRIPVANVLRIEVVSGSSAKLDMRGQTKIANVILKPGVLQISGSWQAVARHYQGGRLNGSAQATATLPALGGQLTLSLEAGAPMSGGPGSGTRSAARRAYYDGSGKIFEQSAGIVLNDRQSVEPGFEFKRTLDWGKLNLNGSFTKVDGSSSSFTEVYAPDFRGSLSRLETLDSSPTSDSYNLNGDLEFPFAGGTAKLITLHQRSTNKSDSLYGFYAGTGAFTRSVRVQSDDRSGESILRGQVNWPLSDAHAVEVSLETAYNFLDGARKVTLNTGADATPPGSDTLVEEYRGEAQISDVWKISPEITIEPSMRFEYSQIKQEARLSPTSSVFAKREFTYPKPGVTATWRPNASQQVRLSLKREVAQLNFRDFVSSVEVVNNQVTAGNADLEPQKAWKLQGEFEQKFWGDGAITFNASYEKVSDVQDQVPVVPLGGSILQAFDGPGNLGDGKKWIVGFKTNIPLKNLGIPNGRLDLDLSSGNSEVVDPVTGKIREFSDAFFNRSWRVAFRQDVPELGFSYGFSFGETGGGTSYRLKETYKRQRTGGDLSVFIETKKILGLNIRAGVNDSLDPAFIATRAVYSAPRSTGSLVLVQQNEARNGPFGYIRVSNTF